jgi:hypothetical protein
MVSGMDAFADLIRTLVLVIIVAAAARALLDRVTRSTNGKPRGIGRRPAEARAYDDGPLRYRRSRGLFTPTEARFLSSLDAAVGSTHRVFGKVRLADVIDVDSSRSKAMWQRAFNRISAKHLDYLVCERDSLDVVAAIELDDASHGIPDRQVRDRFVEDALATAHVRLVRIPVASTYDTAWLRSRILGTVEGAAVTAPAAATAPGAPRCPSCGSTMQLRSTARGAGVQQYFVCDGAPTCAGRVPVRRRNEPTEPLR